MTDKELLDFFYLSYESCWDYLHNVADRGLLLAKYIREDRPEFQYLFNQPEPKHFSSIPNELQEGFIVYLKEYIADLWDIAFTNVEYTDLIAAKEHVENKID